MDIVEQLRDRACQSGLPHTADNPREDHGHTDCWLHHQAADEIERLNESLHRAWDELSRLRGYLNAWADADDAREGHSATCFEHGTCGVEMCREENGLRLGVWR